MKVLMESIVYGSYVKYQPHFHYKNSHYSCDENI